MWPQVFAYVGTTQSVPFDYRRPDGVLQIRFNFDRYSPNASRPLFRQEVRPDKNIFGMWIKNGNNALSYTSLRNLVIELNSHLIQEAFPPKTDTIQFIKSASYWALSYYEWHTDDGWKVRCGFDDSVTLERRGEKEL
jgi:hypothetical protein